jgi:L-fuculose-phosphate aldolase
MGARVAAALGPHRAALLKNHGVVAVGASIEEAVITAINLENAAKIQLFAEAVGEPAAEFPPDDIAKLRRETTEPDQFAVNFNYLARRVQRHER